MLAAAVGPLSKPANVAWVMARIAALLDPYFDKGTPQSIREIEADDWADALAEYPAWAIQRACRWWKSEDNKDRRKRPLEGDIASRCRVEMGPVNAAKITLTSRATQSSQPQEREPLSEAERAEQVRRMAEAGNKALEEMKRKAQGNN